jgi:hypothetical protein
LQRALVEGQLHADNRPGNSGRRHPREEQEWELWGLSLRNCCNTRRLVILARPRRYVPRKL